MVSPGNVKIGDQENIRLHIKPVTPTARQMWEMLAGLCHRRGLRTATWVPGTAGHSWQGVAAGGTSIGLKGTKLAAQVLADTAQEFI